jgi:hypothetical protein
MGDYTVPGWLVHLFNRQEHFRQTGFAAASVRRSALARAPVWRWTLPWAAAALQLAALRELPIFWLALSRAGWCASVSWQQRLFAHSLFGLAHWGASLEQY